MPSASTLLTICGMEAPKASGYTGQLGDGQPPEGRLSFTGRRRHDGQLTWKSQEPEEIWHSEGDQLDDASAADTQRYDCVGLVGTPHGFLAEHRYRR